MYQDKNKKPVFQYEGLIIAERDPVYFIAVQSILGKEFFKGCYVMLSEIITGESIHGVILSSTCN